MLMLLILELIPYNYIFILLVSVFVEIIVNNRNTHKITQFFNTQIRARKPCKTSKIKASNQPVYPHSTEISETI